MQWVLILFPDGEHSGVFLFHRLSQAYLGEYFEFSLKSLPSGRLKTSLFQRDCSILHCHFSLSPSPFHQSYDLHYHLCMFSPNYMSINKASFDTCKMHALCVCWSSLLGFAQATQMHQVQIWTTYVPLPIENESKHSPSDACLASCLGKW